VSYWLSEVLGSSLNAVTFTKQSFAVISYLLVVNWQDGADCGTTSQQDGVKS
jgi:hypothetical protein